MSAKIAQLIPAADDYVEHLPMLRSHAVAGLRIAAVRLGKVLDEDSVMLEGLLEATVSPPMLRYTALAYPAGQVPA